MSADTVMGQDLAITASASLHQDCYEESHPVTTGTQNTDGVLDDLSVVIHCIWSQRDISTILLSTGILTIHLSIQWLQKIVHQKTHMI